MKKNSLIFYLFFIALLIFTFTCNENPTTDDTSSKQDDTNISPVGNWQFQIYPMLNIIVDTLNIALEFSDDSSFYLELNERSEKILFNSTGEWQATEDSIYLTGSKCTILDTTSNALIPLEDSICSLPIPLPYPQKENNWKIKTANLATMLEAFPIDSQYVESIPDYIWEIKFIKK